EVRIDIVDLLKLKNPKVFISGFDRNNLKIVVEKAVVKKVYLLTYIKNNIDSSGIIYCSTRKDVDKIYDMLITNGINAEKYHAGLS
ncbi:ATP-dependent DNA helicase RecQ, partial [Bifidobacterium longum]|nr:ATP-dependent DNA helicase RecQ [Bifidobacterium longum]